MYNSAVRKLLIGRGVSEAGTAIRQVALALIIFSINENQRDVFVAESIESAGVLLSVIIFPFFIDKLGKKTLLLTSEILNICTAGLLIYGAISKSLPILFLGGGLMMASATFSNSAYNKFFAMASKMNKTAMRGNFVNLQNIIFTGALAGLISSYYIIDLAGLIFLLYLDLFSFLVSLVFTFSALQNETIPENTRETTITTFFHGWKTEWVDGFRECLANQKLRSLLIGNAFIGFSSGLFESVVVVNQIESKGFDNKIVSATRSGGRIGGILGGVLLSKILDKIQNTKPVILTCSSLYLLGTLWLTKSFTPFSYFCLMALLVGSSAMLMPLLKVEINSSISGTDLLGRVSVFRSFLVFSLALIGNLTVLALSYFFNTNEFLILSGATYCIGGFIIARQITPDSNQQN